MQTGRGEVTFTEGKMIRLDFLQQALDGCPCFSLKQIENIDACLCFLAAKGVNIKGLCAEGERTLN